MLQQTVWTALRTVTQIVALNTGGGLGKSIIQMTQLLNIIGSPGGYDFSINAFLAVLATPEARTSQLGVLAGVTMLGSAAGYTSELNLAGYRD